MSIGKFLGGVGALIYNPPDNTYLMLRRSSTKDVGAGKWECVTGRVDQGEGFEQAVLREVYEEIGAYIQLDMLIGTTHFYRGEAIADNELIGVFYSGRLKNPTAPIFISEEHSQYRWMTPQQVIDELSDKAHRWISHLVQRDQVMRQLLPQALIAVFHQEGFEI
ncbi:MAG: NUDIX domain-containing protein [bacterium]|nr:NUDIX domain-containing protein [bacterium]